ncbi:CbiQ ABC-type cobalt transport system, permease component CbiQ and related transporters [Candidatus Nanopelagicaceae bacterium]
MKKPLHPLTLWIWALLTAIGVVTLDSTWVALAAMGVAILIVKVRADGSPWNSTFSWSLRIAAFIIAIRAIVGVLIGVPIPGTELFRLPILQLPSWMPGIRIGGAVTSERLTSSLHEGIIIATIILLFGAASALTSPHKLLRVLPFFIYEIGITLVIAASVFPQLVQSLQRIRKAQRLRGIEKVGIRNLALPLLEEALTRSLQLAESMDSRGYGVSRRRSRYRPSAWNLRDTGIIIFALLTAGVMVAQ